MATTNEPGRPLEFMISEANGRRSREQITLVSGAGALKAGTVLGKISASGKYQTYDNASGTAAVNVGAAILCYDVDATSADQLAAVIVRDAEVHSAGLLWGTNDGAGITAGKADLLALGVIVRD